MKFGGISIPTPPCFGNTHLGDKAKGGVVTPPRPGPYPKGYQFAKKENFTEDAHNRRMSGLRKAWGKNQLRNKGENHVGRYIKGRQRARLKTTVAKELHEIQNIARTHAAEAMRRLASIVNNSDQESMVIAAASVIFDRAYGKASQTNINANVNADGKPSEISGKDLDQRINQAIKRVEDLTGGKAKAPKGKERPADIRQPDRDPDGTTRH